MKIMFISVLNDQDKDLWFNSVYSQKEAIHSNLIELVDFLNESFVMKSESDSLGKRSIALWKELTNRKPKNSIFCDKVVDISFLFWDHLYFNNQLETIDLQTLNVNKKVPTLLQELNITRSQLTDRLKEIDFRKSDIRFANVISVFRHFHFLMDIPLEEVSERLTLTTASYTSALILAPNRPGCFVQSILVDKEVFTHHIQNNYSSPSSAFFKLFVEVRRDLSPGTYRMPRKPLYDVEKELYDVEKELARK